MSDALTGLIELLRVEPIGEGLYRGQGSHSDGAPGTYGGHFLGQAAAAALASVEDSRRIHSLHAYFLRGGEPGRPIDYTVTPLRDGRTFCSRRVTASQGGPPIFELTASVATPETGEPVSAVPPVDFAALPDPEALPRFTELMATLDPLPLPAEWCLRERGVDVRVVNAPWVSRGLSAAGGIRAWIRADGALPDDPDLHAAVLAYQSDESISDNVLVPFGKTWSDADVFCVSLDHGLWYHRPFRMDEWLFVDQQPVTIAQSRGFARGSVWNQSGELVASFAQEAVIRV